MKRVLIAGVSTRAAAESAAQAGFVVTAIDAFGDLDQHASVRSVPLPFELRESSERGDRARRGAGTVGKLTRCAGPRPGSASRRRRASPTRNRGARGECPEPVEGGQPEPVEG